jgi:hypothetical protein
MGIDADIRIVGETEVHDGAEDAMSLRIAGDTMDDMIRKSIIYPLTIVYL